MDKLLRFSDLKSAGIVKSWAQLSRMMSTVEFPTGFLLSPGIRVWDATSIEEWLDARRAMARRA